jgi:signal transduction histidine kinase
MAKLGQSSFRRILLSRLLLLSVPVLLLGVYMTYRKARSTLLATARQNLIESAHRKGEDIQQSVAALRANMVMASESVALKSPSPEAHQQFISQFAQLLPTDVQCVQLSNPNTNEITATTCGNRVITTEAAKQWPQQLASLPSDRPQVYVSTALPQNPIPAISTQENPQTLNDQLLLVFSTPIYNEAGQLQSILKVQSALLNPQHTQPRSLSGYAVVINQQGTILTHVEPERVGHQIRDEKDGGAIELIVKMANRGDQSYLHLFNFEKSGAELVAGYTAVESPITSEANQKWTILSVAKLDSVLYGLKDIQQVLFGLTCLLIVVSFLATLYVARELARPLEKLRDYALNDSHLHSPDQMPHNFKIREFNQLSEAFNSMISRLKTWAEELESAWKEAQAANQLKSEFLASTSHELRTPLNGIIGCLRLVRDGFCDDREEELDFLQRADDAAIHLLGIINDVLDLAKIEAGKLSVEIEPINLRQILDEVINLQAVPIRQKGLELYTSDLHEVMAVHADPAKLKQVLLNVIGNALKFTESGSITISTRIEPIPETSTLVDSGSGEKRLELPTPQTEKPNHLPVIASENNPEVHQFDADSRVVVTVKDTGIGIDPAQQHKLFRPFVMVDGSTTRKCGGTGLGLAISRNLMQLMGGNIELFSEGDDQGTTVEISLPAIEPSLLLSSHSQKASSTDQDWVEGDTSIQDSQGNVSSSKKPQLENYDPAL